MRNLTLAIVVSLLAAASVAGQQLTVEPKSLAFLYSPISGVPSAQTITVLSTGTSTQSFTTQVETQDNLGWIEVTGPSNFTPTFLTVSVKPVGLAPGNYTGSIVLVGPAGTSSPVVIPITLSVISGGRVISQIADGGAWKTTLLLVNSGPTPGGYTLRFWQDNGLPLDLPIEGRGVLNRLEGFIPPAGLRVFETQAIAPAVVQGWAEVSAAPAVSALAVFRHQLPGIPAMEAVSPVTLSGKRFLLAFDNEAGFVTSMALVNASSQDSAAINVRFQDDKGGSLGSGLIEMPPRGHQAFRLLDRYPALAGRKGVAEFSIPTEVITGLGLRFHPLGAFTSFPIFADPNPSGVRVPNRVLPQIADGAGWKTTLIVQNTDVQAASVQLRFWQGEGTALTIPIQGYPAGQSVQVNIPVGGLVSLESSGLAQNLSQGWAEIISAASLETFAVFRQQVAGRPDFEAGVPVTPPLTRFLVPYDNTQGFVTSVAISNPDAFRLARVNATLRDEEGAEFGSATFSLPARGHTAFAFPDRFPATRDRRGVVEFFSSAQALCALGLRFHPGGAFTSFPVLSR